MRDFDKEEQLIHDSFKVDDIDVDGFKARLDFTKMTKTKKASKLPKLIAAILIFGFLSVGTVYATGNGWQFLQNLFNSSFAELAIVPNQPIYTESQGIRIEILGAEEIDETILLYLSVQDVNGKYGFSHEVSPFPQFDGFTSGSMIGLNFNAETRTHYFEIFLEGIEITPESEIVTLNILNIWIGPDGGDALFGEWVFEVNISDIVHPTIILENVEFTSEEGDFVLDYIRISPVAIHMQGIGNSIASHDLIVEVGDQQIPMWGSTGGENNIRNSPVDRIDIENVTAIIIAGIRIPIE